MGVNVSMRSGTVIDRPARQFVRRVADASIAFGGYVASCIAT
jgi:hypothetical protein